MEKALRDNAFLQHGPHYEKVEFMGFCNFYALIIFEFGTLSSSMNYEIMQLLSFVIYRVSQKNQFLLHYQLVDLDDLPSKLVFP